MLMASDLVEGLAFQPVVGRLAKWLLDRHQETAKKYIARDTTLDEMAAQIGTTREVVCRLLYRFAEEGAVEISRTELMICNSNLLEEYVIREK
jgi:CRP-like cAMP-binding protein